MSYNPYTDPINIKILEANNMTGFSKHFSSKERMPKAPKIEPTVYDMENDRDEEQENNYFDFDNRY